MTDFNRSALEWGAGGHYSGFYDGAGTYSLPSAWRMDRILELAGQHGIRCSSCSTTTASSRHGSTHAGRCDATRRDTPPCQPGDVGFDPGQRVQRLQRRAARRRDATGRSSRIAEARRLFKQRLRYLVAPLRRLHEPARLGAVQRGAVRRHERRQCLRATPASAPTWSHWHAEMSAYLDAIDPYDHLVTTSSWDPTATHGLWSVPGIDIVQIHTYVPHPPNRSAEIRDLVAEAEVDVRQAGDRRRARDRLEQPRDGVLPGHRPTTPGSTLDSSPAPPPTASTWSKARTCTTPCGPRRCPNPPRATGGGETTSRLTRRRTGLGPTFPLNEKLVPAFACTSTARTGRPSAGSRPTS